MVCRFRDVPEFEMYCNAAEYRHIGKWDMEGKPSWCPIIEVPTHHGRLIDADALQSDVLFIDADKEFVYLSEIRRVPTVIEAEE